MSDMANSQTEEQTGDPQVATDRNELPVPKIKHDWYQTEAHVIVTIFVKNAENVKVEHGESTLSVSAQLPSGNEYSLELDLAHPVVSDQCSHKLLPSKIEIKLKKRDGTRWNTLEGDPAVQAPTVQPIPQGILEASSSTSVQLTYPSSCKKSRDWDKVEKEIEKQDAEDVTATEAGVSALLQEIYGRGSDEVKRAMNKSFQESGGTVLSTNWSEVGKGKVERKPPDGVEWKTWNS